MSESIKPHLSPESLQSQLRTAWLAYHQIDQLARSPLTNSVLVQRLLLPNDETMALARGYALKAALDWCLAMLSQQNTRQSAQSHEVITARYIDRLSASNYADRHSIGDSTAQARRRAAIKRIGNIWQRETQSPRGHSDRVQRMVNLRYARFSSPIQTTLRFLSVFDTPIKPAYFKDEPIFPLLQHTPQLLEQNLVITDSTLHAVAIRPEIRPYIKALIQHDEQAAWQVIAARYYEGQQSHLEAAHHWLAAEHPDLAAAIIINAQDGLGNTLAIDSLRTQLAQFNPRMVDADTYAELKLIGGKAAEFVQQLDLAIADYKLALRARHPLIKARAYYQLAEASYQRDMDEALMHYEACRRHLAHLESGAGRKLLAQALIKEAWVFIEARPDFERADRLLEEATTVLSQPFSAEMPSILADLHKTWGLLFGQREQWQEASEHHWRAWQYAQEADDLLQIAQTTHNLGTAYFWLGRIEQAKGHFMSSQTIALELENVRLQALNNKGLGYCAFGSAEYAQAITYYEEARAYFESTGNEHWLAAVCYDLAEAHMLSYQPVPAQKYIAKGLILAAALGNWALQQGLQALSGQYIELREGLNERQRLGLSLIRKQGQVNNEQYRDAVNCSKSTAERDLGNLSRSGLIRKEGKARATRYMLTDA